MGSLTAISLYHYYHLDMHTQSPCIHHKLNFQGIVLWEVVGQRERKSGTRDVSVKGALGP